MTQRMMTADEAFSYSVQRYPSLYASLDEKSTRMAVYDQWFNVLGNGLRDISDLQREFRWLPELAAWTQGVPQKYMGPEPIYEGFTQMQEQEPGEVPKPAFESRIRGFYTVPEQEFHPEVKFWRQREKGTGFGFYPNFTPEYSLVYNVDRSALDASWLHAALYFYEQAQEYFAGAQTDYYSGAWPQDPMLQQKRVVEFERDWIRLGPEEQRKQWATLSDNYGLPFAGDTRTYLATLWEQEKTRIHQFLSDTVQMLESELALRAMPSP